MKPKFARSSPKVVASGAIAAVVLAIAATTVLAQFASFSPSFDGELWGVRHELMPGDRAVPAGVAFVNGTMFVADSENQTLIAYDSAGQMVSIPGAEWNAAEPLSPVFGLVPHQLAAIVVNVDGNDRNAIMVSDADSNRADAFDASGHHLFTLRLQRPIGEPALWSSTGQVAMSSGAKFHLTTATSTLTLSGSFAAAWVEQEPSGEVFSGALAFLGASSTFPRSGSEYLATPSVVLTGTEANPIAPRPQYIFGVTFDTAGNLYVLDAFTERLHVYSPTFSPLFTFGTPDADGTVAEFSEPWGLMFWPDPSATSGRLFVNDTYNSRILIYRPVDGPDADSVIDGLQYESVIRDFVAPAIELFSIAADPASGRIAVTDFALPRVVVLQKPRLATFNVQVLNSNDEVVSSVCTAAEYKVRFSLTVPAGLAAVTGVTPQLSIDGMPTAATPVPAAVFPSSTLSAGQVATYTYTLTAPGAAGADIHAIAGATATNTTDVLMRSETISLADCAGDTDASTITATPSTPPQVSGWTPLYEGDTFTVTLNAQDDDGISSIEYTLGGANSTGDQPVVAEFDGVVTDAMSVVSIPYAGHTALNYRVRDGNGVWSAAQTLILRMKPVIDRMTNENNAAEFRVGDPVGTGFSYSVQGLPAGVAFSTETGQFAGVVSFDAVQPYSADPVLASGVYDVVVTETGPGGVTSSVSFTWTINNINRQPIITNPATTGVSILQGRPFAFQITGVDPDADPAVFTINGRGVNTGQNLPLAIDPVSGLITGVFPVDADSDEYEIRVALAECAERSATAPCDRELITGVKLATHFGFTVAVLDANLPPDITNPGPQTSAEGQSVTLHLQVSDAEEDTLTLGADGLPNGLTIDSSTRTISGTVAFGAAGTYAVTVQVDDHVNTPQRAVSFSWQVTRTNRPPVLQIADRINVEGETLPAGTSFSAYDSDGSAVTFVSASGLPSGITMSASGALSGSLGFNSAGTNVVTVRVSDGTDFTERTINWIVYDRNRAPTLTPANQFSREGQLVSYQVPASDPDGDALSFSINGLPPGLTLNTSTGLVTGTVPANSTGVYTVNIGVADVVPAGSLSLLRTITWTISKNRAPLANADSATAMQGASVAIDVRGNDNDPDNDSLTIVSVTSPTNGLAVIDAVNGTITFTASSPTFLGTSTFSYTITDGMATASATVTVTIVPNNKPPVCSAASGGEIWPPNHKKFYVASINGVTDPDGNPITVKVTGIWQDEPIDSTGDGQFSPDGRIENGQAWIRAERNGHGNKAAGNGRVYEILFTATDSKGASCSGSVLWTVPHDQGQRSTAIDDGVRFDSTGVTPGARDKSQIHQKSVKP